MEPAFQRGDILLLDNRAANPLEVGDVVVYKVDGRDIPIVHRVLEIHERCAAQRPRLRVWAGKGGVHGAPADAACPAVAVVTRAGRTATLTT